MKADARIIISSIFDPDGVKKGVKQAQKEIAKIKNLEIDVEMKKGDIERSKQVVNELEKQRSDILSEIKKKEEDKFKIEQASYDLKKKIAVIEEETLKKLLAQEKRNIRQLKKDVDKQSGIAAETGTGKDRGTLESMEKRLDKAKSKAIELEGSLKQATAQLVAMNAVEASDTTLLDERIAEAQAKATRVVDKGITGAENKLEKDKQSLERINGELEKTKQNLEKIRKNSGKINFEKVGKSAKGVANSVGDILKKVVKWSLAMFGIRSIYLGIRKLTSEVSQFNEQVKTDLSYITFAVAKEFEKIVVKVIEWVYKLLFYLKYILNAWFGINIFANATVDAFKKQEAAVGGTVDKVKELKRELASFDEMNRLNKGLDNTSGGGGGVSGSMPDPSFDLSKFNFPIPEWVEWIARNGDTILTWVLRIGGALALLKLGVLVNDVSKFVTGLFGAESALGGILSKSKLLKTVGIGVAIAGVVMTIENLLKLVNNPSWFEFFKTLQGLGTTILGVGIAMGSWEVALVGLVIALVSYGAELHYSLTTTGAAEKATRELEKAKDDLRKAEENLERTTDSYIRAIEWEEESLKKLKQVQKDNKFVGEELHKEVENGTLTYKDMNKKQREVYKAYLDHENAQKNLTRTTEDLAKDTEDLTKKTEVFDEKEKKAILTGLKKQALTASLTGEYKELGKSLQKAMEDGSISTEEAARVVEKAMITMDKEGKKTFKENLPDYIKNNLKPNVFKTTFDTLEAGFTNVWNNIINIFKKPIKASAEVTTSSSGVKNAKGAIYYPPKLARGGIINYPNHGIPIGSAIGGERGAEGVIPLTDSQMMSQLGEAIGRYITINNTINTQLNGRTINKELRKTQGQENFALNGGLVYGGLL